MLDLQGGVFIPVAVDEEEMLVVFVPPWDSFISTSILRFMLEKVNLDVPVVSMILFCVWLWIFVEYFDVP